MRVLLAVDGTPNGEPAAAAIASWAAESGADLVLLSVLHPRDVRAMGAGKQVSGSLSRDGRPTGQLLRGLPPVEAVGVAEDRSQALTRARAEREDYLRHLAGQWFAGVSVTVRAVAGEDTAGAIVEAAIAEDAALIAMATRGRSAVGQALFGAVHEDVVRRAPMPVLLVGPQVKPGT
ncbi:MAG: universal stress protein [Dehalococcoidia bacterium]